MAKLVLSDLVNLQNESSAVNTINNNSALIEAAIEDTLSRSGTSPNEMNANLDMNSNRILNLPLPVAEQEPVRKGEFDEWTGLAEDLEDAVAAAQLAQAAAEAAEANAETSESNAATSESNAAASELAAAQSESNAATSESNAATSESNAATSESNASTSASTATTQAGIATTQAGIATTQAGNASTSATNANNSAIAAAASAQDAADAFDEFDDIYLGSKTSDPTLDNDGDPLVTGQLYWNSVASNLRIYDGASWNVYSASSGLTAVVDDTTPALGGNLDLNGKDITGTGNIDITGTIEQGGNAVLDAADIGVTVQGYDATILTSSDIGVTVQGYDANTLKTGAIGVTVQGYDADLASWAGVTRGTGFDTAAAINVGTAGSFITNGGALGTPSGGTLTNATGLPIAGLTSSTSTALGVGSIELGHASDTTLSRVSSGVVAVEGLPLNGAFALTDGATPALDASLASTYTLTSTTNPTIGVPSNPIAGQKIVIAFTASGANRTLALNTGTGGFRYGTDVTALTETVSGKTDYVGAIYNSTANKWDVVAYAKGY